MSVTAPSCMSARASERPSLPVVAGGVFDGGVGDDDTACYGSPHGFASDDASGHESPFRTYDHFHSLFQKGTGRIRGGDASSDDHGSDGDGDDDVSFASFSSLDAPDSMAEREPTDAEQRTNQLARVSHVHGEELTAINDMICFTNNEQLHNN